MVYEVSMKLHVNKKNVLLSIALSVLFLGVVAFATGNVPQMTALGPNAAYTTQNGDIVTPRPFLQTILGNTPGACKVTPTFAYCEATRPAAFLTSSVSRYYTEIGWQSYTSCAGWMNYYGCKPADCTLESGATCGGSTTDSSSVQCTIDAQCGLGKACIGATCQIVQCTSSEPFKCENGALYKCSSRNTYDYYSSCNYIVGKNYECAGTTGTDYKALCADKPAGTMTDDEALLATQPGTPASQLLCQSSATCKTGEECRSGLCRPIINPELPPEPTLGPEDLPTVGPTEGAECTEPYTFTCDDATTIMTADCIDGAYTMTGLECADGTPVVIDDGTGGNGTGTTGNKTFLTIAIIGITIIVGIVMVKGGKKR